MTPVMYRALVVTWCVSAVTSRVSAVTSQELHPLSDDVIEYINSHQSSWTAGRNFDEDTPLEYLDTLCGVIKSNDTELDEMEYPPEMLENLPEEFDARKKWPNCPTINDIRDQGHCGSCWAFGAVEVMTDRYCIFSNQTKQFHFSAQDLVSCCDNTEIRCGNCNGGDPMLAFKYWSKYGIVSGGGYNSKQGCYPYEIPPKTSNYDYPTPECKPKCIKEYKVSYENDKHHGKLAYRVPGDENKIKAEIYHNGPVEVAFLVYSDFRYNYKSGVYVHTSGEAMSHHAVKLIGWGVEKNTKYWLLANSWGPNWGDKGFFKFLRGVNHCGIESDIVAGTPVITN